MTNPPRRKLTSCAEQQVNHYRSPREYFVNKTENSGTTSSEYAHADDPAYAKSDADDLPVTNINGSLP